MKSFWKYTAPFVSMLFDLHPEYPRRFFLDNLFISLNLLIFFEREGI